MVNVCVDRVGIDPETQQAVVLLKDKEGKRILPIWIGPAEASAIALSLQGISAPRPLTCDLLKDVLDLFEARMIAAVVTELKNETFYANIVLDTGLRKVEVDSRPSDAIALALRTGAPVYVEEEVLNKAGLPFSDHTVQ
ncbi:MAG TPA: bifunctional nuclease family protein [Firmicutes bacterium]|nr:bifunctional nuclease family protein [Bacillota bacterium]